MEAFPRRVATKWDLWIDDTFTVFAELLRGVCCVMEPFESLFVDSRRKQGGDPALHSQCECSVFSSDSLCMKSVSGWRGVRGLGGRSGAAQDYGAPTRSPGKSRSVQVSQISAFTIQRCSPVAHVPVVETHKFHHNGENERDY